jgi:hypothetical protein
VAVDVHPGRVLDPPLGRLQLPLHRSFDLGDDGSQMVTSLTAEAVSFSSRRVGVKGQSSPQDVACAMLVSLRGVTACWQRNSA